VKVNLSDTDDGMQLLLPVVVQQLLYPLRKDSSFIDLVEEPELHLHPAAHAPLADLFLQTAQSDQGQVIVETHSENFLLRIRRRIAEGADPNLVALYWIEDLNDAMTPQAAAYFFIHPLCVLVENRYSDGQFLDTILTCLAPRQLSSFLKACQNI
jgi:hypothetical protein